MKRRATGKRRDPYEVLGVAKNASPAAIKKAFRRKARETHPDVAGGGAEMFTEANQAYGLLMDAGRRAEYDASGIQDEAAPMAASVLLQFFDAALGAALSTDGPCPLRDLVRNDMLEARKKNEASIAKIRQQLRRARKWAGKITSAEGTENYLGLRVAALVDELEGAIAMGESRTRELDSALELLEAFAFAPDSMELRWKFAGGEYGSGNYSLGFETFIRGNA